MNNEDKDGARMEANRKRTKSSKGLSLKEKLDMEAPINEFITNEVVFAAIPGFSPWPARILSISGHTIFVEFFGTGQM